MSPNYSEDTMTMPPHTLRLHALAALARAYADQAEARSLAASRSAHHAAAHAAPHAPLLARRAEKARATARHRARQQYNAKDQIDACSRKHKWM